MPQQAALLDSVPFHLSPHVPHNASEWRRMPQNASDSLRLPLMPLHYRWPFVNLVSDSVAPSCQSETPRADKLYETPPAHPQACLHVAVLRAGLPRLCSLLCLGLCSPCCHCSFSICRLICAVPEAMRAVPVREAAAPHPPGQ